ncbi:hypothetical protein MKW92_011318 [Papaver armeniacum]|nr:hypothetical protein MKW92_011318 [Papaver armeniacum]
MLGCLRVTSRSLLTSAITTTVLLSSPGKNTLLCVSNRLSSSSSNTKDAKQLTPPPPAFDLGAEFTHPDKAIMETICPFTDLVEKNRHSSTYLYHLWNLLTCDRLGELDKQEWKASWHEEGKPRWLGNIPTRANGRLYITLQVLLGI